MNYFVSVEAAKVDELSEVVEEEASEPLLLKPENLAVKSSFRVWPSSLPTLFSYVPNAITPTAIPKTGSRNLSV